MNRTVKRIHTYAGLLTLVNLLVFAVTGIAQALHRPRLLRETTAYADYQPVPGERDRDTAERLASLLGLTLATPVQAAAIQHDAAGNLLLDFYHANGRHRVTVLPDQHLLSITITRNALPRYLDILHMTTGVFRSGDKRMQMWAYYNEVALWCLLMLLGSGAWMAWDRFRQRRWWSPASVRTAHFLTAVLVFPLATLYAVTSLPLAHRTWFPATGLVTWANHVHRTGGFFALVMGLAILALTASGVYVWSKGRSNRAIELLVTTTVASALVALIVSMREY
jgi:uncharacterized iron-regulated membrane protein